MLKTAPINVKNHLSPKLPTGHNKLHELSTRIGRTNQNMANKLKRDNFSMNELIEIAEALDCTLDVTFINNEPTKTE